MIDPVIDPVLIVERVKGILISPTETFQDVKNDKAIEAIIYFFSALSITLIMWGLLIVTGNDRFTDFYGINYGTFVALDTAQIGCVIVGVLVGGLISLGVASMLINVLINRFTGGGNGLSATLKAVAYSAPPIVFLGWIPIFVLDGIPIFTLIGIIWSVILCTIGVRELHDTTTPPAAAAVILPPFIIVFIIIYIILVAAIRLLKWVVLLTLERM